jgi:carboxylate-amine ligase
MLEKLPPFTLGVEEEYQIIDPQTRELKDGIGHVLPEAQDEVGEAAQSELFQSQIEIGTPVCEDLSQVRREITRLRRAIIDAAESDGEVIAACSTHPISRAEDQKLTPKARYRGIEANYRQIARMNLIWGCHVHVGIENAEATIQIMNRARGWLPVLVALSANSPFWSGEDTGYASFRTEIWRLWPMAGSPQPFRNRAEYDALVQSLVTTKAISDETKIYWDLRPADRYGTIEFRATDIGLTVDDAVMIAGIAQAIARSAFEDYGRDVAEETLFQPVRPEMMRAAEWRAARYGLEGELIDVHAGEVVPAPVLVERLLNWLRPALEAGGNWEEVSQLVAQVLERGNGARRQREVYQRNGELTEVVDFVVRETAAGV